jgi:ABC-2 type transport system permease protein
MMIAALVTVPAVRVIASRIASSVVALFVARGDMAGWLRAISDALPLSYAYDALARVAAAGPYGGWFAADVAVTAGAAFLALLLGAATLRRRTG